jgi:quinolinate synthase
MALSENVQVLQTRLADEIMKNQNLQRQIDVQKEELRNLLMSVFQAKKSIDQVADFIGKLTGRPYNRAEKYSYDP